MTRQRTHATGVAARKTGRAAEVPLPPAEPRGVDLDEPMDLGPRLRHLVGLLIGVDGPDREKVVGEQLRQLVAEGEPEHELGVEGVVHVLAESPTRSKRSRRQKLEGWGTCQGTSIHQCRPLTRPSQ